MSFAALRQTVVQAHALDPDYFGEEVQMSAPDDSGTTVTARVKIVHEQSGPKKPSFQSGSGNEERRGTFDERERIRVQVSRDPLWSYSYSSRPQPAATLKRDSSIDSDSRPFTFRGEVVYEGDQHAVYVFERPRRVAQGKGY